jgi:hypothetical protein
VLIFSVSIFNFSHLMNLSLAFRPCGLGVRSDGFSFSIPMCTARTRSPSDMLRKLMSVRPTRKPVLFFFMVYYCFECTACDTYIYKLSSSTTVNVVQKKRTSSLRPRTIVAFLGRKHRRVSETHWPLRPSKSARYTRRTHLVRCRSLQQDLTSKR